MSASAATIGHNNPPGPIELSRDIVSRLSDFLASNPVILDEGAARDAAAYLKQGKASADEIEAERVRLTRPLNERVRSINAEHNAPKATVDRVCAILAERLTIFTRAEEARRLAEAAEKRRLAEAAERAAREAERVEREAHENASLGEVGVDIVQSVAAADAAFSNFKRADREAARSVRDVPVRLATGYGRAVSMRARETLVLQDAGAAVAAIGVTEKIREAILSAARDFRRLRGSLPAGVSSTTDRHI